MKDLLIDDCALLMDVADITGYDYEELFDIAMSHADKELDGKCPYKQIDIVHKAFTYVANEAYIRFLRNL